MKLRQGDIHTFEFFRDSKNRLRATWLEMGKTKPVESIDGKRYDFSKVFDVNDCFSDNDSWTLQLAGEGQVVKVTAL